MNRTAKPYFLIHQTTTGTAQPPVYNVPTMEQWAEGRTQRRSRWKRALRIGGK